MSYCFSSYSWKPFYFTLIKLYGVMESKNLHWMELENKNLLKTREWYFCNQEIELDSIEAKYSVVFKSWGKLVKKYWWTLERLVSVTAPYVFADWCLLKLGSYLHTDWEIRNLCLSVTFQQDGFQVLEKEIPRL